MTDEERQRVNTFAKENSLPLHKPRTSNGGADEIKDDASKPQVELPRYGRNRKEFSHDMAAHLAPLRLLFQKEGKVVELIIQEFDHQLDERGLAHGGFKFQEMEPCRAVTWIEDHLVIGREIKKEGNN